MRKKYLSALLFGALLFASAGTFQSCKDYDDDINNLQEQINTINTSLGELTDKINALGAGVTDFKYENGKLVIVTDKGTNFEVTLPEADGIKELEIKDGVLYADGEAVGPVAGEGGAVSVEVKDGVFYINGEAQELEVGSNVVVTDNGDGTYTLIVDGTSIVLPKASVDVAVALQGEFYFTNLSYNKQDADGGIQWGTAEKYKGDWKGLKPVTKGQLLVGQTKTISVKTLAATYDLSTAKLTLVNTLGEPAPVTVTPVAEGKQGPAVSDSRAADKNGMWDLQIAMTSDVTADNIETAFATNINNSPENIKYALYVDDMRATGYDFIIDTDENALAQRALTFDVNKLFFDGVPAAVATGSPTIGVEYEFNKPIEILYGDGSVYDYKVELTTGDEDEAEARGVEIGADGKSIVVKPTASGKTPSGVEFGLWVNMIDVNGNTVDKEEVYIKFGKMEMANIRLSTVPYKVVTSDDANAKNLIIELVKDGEYIFENLTADQVDNNLAGKWNLTVSDGDKFLLSNSDWTTASTNIKYYATLEAAQKFGNDDIDLSDPSDKRKARQIKYAVIPVNSYNTNAKPTDGDPYELKLTLTTGSNAEEIKEITVPVDVQLPTWDEIFNQNNTASMWEDGAFKSRLQYDGINVKIALNGAYINNSTNNDADFGNAYVKASLQYDKTTGELTTIGAATDGTFVGLGTNDVTLNVTQASGKLTYNKVQFEVGYKIANINGFEITKKFDVQLMSLFEGAEFAWYTEKGKTGTPAQLNGQDNIIMSSNNGTDLGLTFRFAGKVLAADVKSTVEYYGSKVSAPQLGGYVLTTVTPSAADEIQYTLSASTVNGTSCTAEAIQGGIQITTTGNPIEVGEAGTLKATFKDPMGVITTAEIPFVKIVGTAK